MPYVKTWTSAAAYKYIHFPRLHQLLFLLTTSERFYFIISASTIACKSAAKPVTARHPSAAAKSATQAFDSLKDKHIKADTQKSSSHLISQYMY